jgi:hypothetical protein
MVVFTYFEQYFPTVSKILKIKRRIVIDQVKSNPQLNYFLKEIPGNSIKV